MKRLVIFLLSVFMVSCASIQTLPKPKAAEDLFTNTKTSVENYVLANEWMVETFNNAQSVIQFSDKDQGIIKGRYFLASGTKPMGMYTPPQTIDFYSIITIRVRDQQVKIEIEPPVNDFYTYKDGWDNIERGYTPEMFNTDTQRLIDSFKSRMMSEKSDW